MPTVPKSAKGDKISLKVDGLTIGANDGASSTAGEEDPSGARAQRDRRRRNRAADYNAGTGVSMTLIENNLGSLTPTRWAMILPISILTLPTG